MVIATASLNLLSVQNFECLTKLTWLSWIDSHGESSTSLLVVFLVVVGPPWPSLPTPGHHVQGVNLRACAAVWADFSYGRSCFSLRGISDASFMRNKLHYYQDKSIPCWLQTVQGCFRSPHSVSHPKDCSIPQGQHPSFPITQTLSWFRAEKKQFYFHSSCTHLQT